jgi:hypothetical protein
MAFPVASKAKRTGLRWIDHVRPGIAPGAAEVFPEQGPEHGYTRAFESVLQKRLLPCRNVIAGEPALNHPSIQLASTGSVAWRVRYSSTS